MARVVTAAVCSILLGFVSSPAWAQVSAAARAPVSFETSVTPTEPAQSPAADAAAKDFWDWLGDRCSDKDQSSIHDGLFSVEYEHVRGAGGSLSLTGVDVDFDGVVFAHTDCGGTSAGKTLAMYRGPNARQSTSAVQRSIGWTLGLTADVSFLTSSTQFFGAGPRFTVRPLHGPVAFFGQVEVGALHTGGGPGFSGSTDFALAPGGGVIVILPRSRFAIQGKIAFPIDFFSGGHATDTVLSGGVAISMK